MLKDILAVSGKPGLYKLVSKGANLTIIESLIDKKRIPAYARDKIISVGDVSIFITDGDVLIGEVFTSIKEKEDGKPVPFDFTKADNDKLRAYFAEVLPNFDREKVYPSDIRKLLKWYDILITNGITDFSKEESGVEEPKEEVTEEDGKEELKTAVTANTPPPAKPATAKPKGKAMTAAKSAQTPKSKPMGAIPKKSIVGSKRGS